MTAILSLDILFSIGNYLGTMKLQNTYHKLTVFKTLGESSCAVFVDEDLNADLEVLAFLLRHLVLDIVVGSARIVLLSRYLFLYNKTGK